MKSRSQVIYASSLSGYGTISPMRPDTKQLKSHWKVARRPGNVGGGGLGGGLGGDGGGRGGGGFGGGAGGASLVTFVTLDSRRTHETSLS